MKENNYQKIEMKESPKDLLNGSSLKYLIIL